MAAADCSKVKRDANLYFDPSLKTRNFSRAILKYTQKDERVLSNFLGRGSV